MYTRWLWAMAISVAVAGMMWQLGGFGDLFAGTSPGDSLDSPDNLSQSANDSPVNESFTGDAAPQDGNLVGLVLSGIGRFIAAIGFVVNLPGELLELGLPPWAHQPIRDLIYIIGGIAVIQIAAGRIWQ